MVAIALIAIGFPALYAINSQCLYVVNASRQAFDCNQALQDRMEQFRNCTWAQVTDSSYVAGNIMNIAGKNSGSLKSITEVVTINAYPTAVNPPIQITRSNGTITVNSTNAAIASGNLVKIDITLSWTQGLGKKSRLEACSAIYGQNSR